MTETPPFFLLSPLSPVCARLREAEAFFLAGNLNEALAAAQQAWREHPREPEVFRVLAYLHMARGEYPPAEQAAHQAVLLDDANPLSHAMLAQVYLAFDIRRSADELLTKAVARFPNELSLIALLADLSFRQRQYPRAVEMANRVLQANAHDGYMHALLGQYQLQRRQYGLAGGHLAEAVAAYPQRADYARDLGIARLRQGDYPAAARALSGSLALRPSDVMTQRCLFLALKLLPGGGWYWRAAHFFFKYAAFGWILIIAAFFTAGISGIWLLVAAVAGGSDFWDVFNPGALLVVSLALIVLLVPGLHLAGRKGERFEARLHKMQEQQGLIKAPEV